MPMCSRITDWSVLAPLLRQAQQQGVELRFSQGIVTLCSPQTPPGVLRVPLPLIGRARAQGWQVSVDRARVTLRHPDVAQTVQIELAN